MEKEDPSEGDEDEGNEPEEEDEEEEDDADSGSDDDDDTKGSGASGDEDSSGGHNVVEEEADEAEEHEESPSRSNEDGGDAREGSDSEVDSPAQLRRTRSGRGSRKAVHRGVLVLGKGKGTMADVRRSLSGGQSMRPAGLVRRSMPAPVEPQHPVAASPVAAENLLQMPIRVTGNAQPMARKRLVLPLAFN